MAEYIGNNNKDSEFKAKIIAIQKFNEEYKRLPRDSGNSVDIEVEYARLLNKLRQAQK